MTIISLKAGIHLRNSQTIFSFLIVKSMFDLKETYSMLRFATKPDHIFTQIINDSLDMSIDSLRLSEEGFGDNWIDEYTFKLFGSRNDIIIHEMKKLRTANNSPDLFMPTDYHFRLLDRVLDWYCDLYNDSITFSTDMLMILNGKPIKHIDINEIRTTFLWDNDYELLDSLLVSQNKELSRKILGELNVEESGINIQLGKLADLKDLTLEQYQHDPDWGEVDDDFWFSQ